MRHGSVVFFSTETQVQYSFETERTVQEQGELVTRTAWVGRKFLEGISLDFLLAIKGHMLLREVPRAKNKLFGSCD